MLAIVRHYSVKKTLLRDSLEKKIERFIMLGLGTIAQ